MALHSHPFLRSTLHTSLWPCTTAQRICPIDSESSRQVIPLEVSNRRVERLDAIRHFDLSLHRGIEHIMDLQNDPASGCFLHFHDRLWTHCLLLPKSRLFLSALCCCAYTHQHAELSSTVRDEHRLSILLFRPTHQLLVPRNLFHHGNGSFEESFSGVSDD